MEEILASIRKIIESGDERPETGAVGAIAGTASVAAEITAPDAPTDAVASVDRSAQVAKPASTAENEAVAIDAVDDPVAAAGSPDAFFDVDFADLKLELEQEFAAPDPVVATLRPSSEAVRADPAPHFPAAPAEIERAAADWPLRSDGRHAAIRAAAAVAGDRQATRPSPPEPQAALPTASTPSTPIPTTIAGPPHRPANSDDPRMRDFREAILRDSERAPARPSEPLVSSRSGDLVNASFEELDRAIRDGQLRSMEEMAEEMMRPLLQEWLDDNLPRIVERLVREEIERVARGGR